MDTKTSLSTKICLTEDISSIQIRHYCKIKEEGGLELYKIEITGPNHEFDDDALNDYKTKYNATVTHFTKTKRLPNAVNSLIYPFTKVTINPKSLQEGSPEKADVEKTKQAIIEKLSSAIK